MPPHGGKNFCYEGLHVHVADVELVMSTIAITLSGLSLIATTTLAVLQYRHSSKPKLKVKQTYAYPATPGVGIGSPHIAIAATNSRQTPVTITGWGTTWPEGSDQTLQFVDHVDDFGQTIGPVEASHGTTIARHFALSRIQERLVKSGLDFPVELRAFVNTAAGATFYSKPFSVDSPSM